MVTIVDMVARNVTSVRIHRAGRQRAAMTQGGLSCTSRTALADNCRELPTNGCQLTGHKSK